MDTTGMIDDNIIECTVNGSVVSYECTCGVDDDIMDIPEELMKIIIELGLTASDNVTHENSD